MRSERRPSLEPESRRSLIFAGAAVIALAVGGGFLAAQTAPHSHIAPPPLVRPEAPSGEEPFASVTPLDDASWSRHRRNGDEFVRLTDGSIAVAVRQLAASAHFRVYVPDGELEGRGTRFQVSVRDDHTARILVNDGVVAFRQAGQADVLLGPSDEWPPPPKTTALDTASPHVTKPPPALPREKPDGAVATAYEVAVDAYRAKRWSDAATALAAFVDAYPTARESEDAMFLQASALAHDGQSEAAAESAAKFLAKYPSSFHALDAAILVARDARDRGHCQDARDVVASWRSSHPAETSAALGVCAQ